jgi:hypothetical protein
MRNEKNKEMKELTPNVGVTQTNSLDVKNLKGDTMSNTKTTIQLPIKTEVNTRPVPPWWIRDYYNKMYSDEYFLQRLLEIWPEYRSDSFFNGVFTGASEVDNFILVNILDVLEDLIEKINSLDEDDERLPSFQHTVDYLKGINDNGYEYLILDGQHRLDRINSLFLDDYIYNGEIVSIQILEENKNPYMYTINGNKFSNWPEPLKNNILGLNEDHSPMNIKELPLKFIVTMVNSCQSFNDLVNLTINSNEHKPWTNHEKRIIIPSLFNHFVQDLCWETPQIKEMFKKTKNMTGEKSLKSKGDTYVVSNWGAWLDYSNKSNNSPNVWPSNDDLDRQSKIDNMIPKTTLNHIKSVVRIMSEGLYDIKDKFKPSTLDNAFMLTASLTNSSHQLNPVGKKISIIDNVKWMDWFMRTEIDRLEHDKWYLNKNGNVVKNINGKPVVNPESYFTRCGGTKPEGLQLRQKMMIDDFNRDMNDLIDSGVIELKETGKYTKSNRKTLASLNDWSLFDGTPVSYKDVADGSKIHVNHQQPASKNGDTTLENGELMKSKENIKLSNVGG